jgi:hypothetical protein
MSTESNVLQSVWGVRIERNNLAHFQEASTFLHDVSNFLLNIFSITARRTRHSSTELNSRSCRVEMYLAQHMPQCIKLTPTKPANMPGRPRSPLFFLIALFVILHLLPSGTCELDDSAFSSSVATQKLADKHLVMMGDSLMRYQYMSLVYALKFEKLVKDKGSEDFCIEKTWPSWIDYFNKTNTMLRPQEQCDCFRPQAFDYHKFFENRYYNDEAKKLKITYIWYTGGHIQGHWMNSSNSDDLRKPETTLHPPLWKTDIHGAMEGFLKTLIGVKKNSILVLNTGQHVHGFGAQGYGASVHALASKIFEQVAWRTTTSRMPSMRDQNRDPRLHERTQQDDIMCAIPGITCLNISWTQDLGESNYSDWLHFNAPVYNLMNAQMLTSLI